MRNSNQQSLKEAINHLLKEYNLIDKMNEYNLVNSWEKVMGKSIARHTLEISVSNKKLFLVIDSPSLKKELSMGKSNIIQLMNQEVGAEVISAVEIR